MSLALATPRLHLTYEPDIETLEWIGGGRCGVYYMWFESRSVGAISMTSVSRANGEIGYEMEPGFHGLGFATEALAAVVQAAHVHHGFTVLSAQAYAENTASRRVLEKTGFLPVSARLNWCESAGLPLAVVKYRRLTNGVNP
ncbi:MAG: GNAT family N-acetyltransferase [Hyphomicrobiaceae bacterium]